MFKFNKSSGAASRLLLVLAIVVLVAVIIVYLVMRMASKPPAPPQPTSTNTIPLPVYQQTLDNVNFVFLSALDKGGVLKASDVTNGQNKSPYQKDLVIDNPGAKFIEVTVGAQNTGTVNTGENIWTIENIVDSKGRNFVPLDQNAVSPWLPNPNLCGKLLKPAFDPTPCEKIYEVSDQSDFGSLKIRVEVLLSNSKKDSFLLDMIVK